MLGRRLFLLYTQPQFHPICLLCSARSWPLPRTTPQRRPLSSSTPLQYARPRKEKEKGDNVEKKKSPSSKGRSKPLVRKNHTTSSTARTVEAKPSKKPSRKLLSGDSTRSTTSADEDKPPKRQKTPKPKSLKEALLEGQTTPMGFGAKLDIKTLQSEDLHFKPLDVPVSPIPMLSYGLDRVLFNPGVYRLQDPRSRVYNFDPYLEKIMQVTEFDFKALAPYKTSSKDEELLELTKRLGIKYTGSTSSMSGILQHFHFLLSKTRGLNHDMLSRTFPNPTDKFSKITSGPSAVFLRWKNGTYAIDADKAYDSPNIMSWLGHSMEKLLTTDKEDFERYRKSSPSKAPHEEDNRCFHYSTQGNFLMRSQLDARDPRLPGTGVFDLKTRAVVSIRMNHSEYEAGAGYQLRFDRGEWESFEREFYDMTRATMLKYSLQVRMGRMDGIFVAYHNIERIFGFQYLSLPDMDSVLHGQTDTCLGDQEFKFSVQLLDELLEKATEKFPEQTLRLHFYTRPGVYPFMYIFAEPVTDEQADAIQSRSEKANKEFERDVIGIEHSEEELQEEWNKIQGEVDESLETEMEEADGSSQESSEAPNALDEDEHKTQAREETDPIQVDEDTLGEASEQGEDSEDSDATLVDGIETASPASGGPLIGWTLAIRNRVDGQYVDRPMNLKPDQRWTIEYHIKEIDDNSIWALYEKVKLKRNKLIGDLRDENTKSLDRYREIIKKYTNAGRTWREEQDVIDEKLGVRVYEPMGPGSPLYETKGSPTKKQTDV